MSAASSAGRTGRDRRARRAAPCPYAHRWRRARRPQQGGPRWHSKARPEPDRATPRRQPHVAHPCRLRANPLLAVDPGTPLGDGQPLNLPSARCEHRKELRRQEGQSCATTSRERSARAARAECVDVRGELSSPRWLRSPPSAGPTPRSRSRATRATRFSGWTAPALQRSTGRPPTAHAARFSSLRAARSPTAGGWRAATSPAPAAVLASVRGRRQAVHPTARSGLCRPGAAWPAARSSSASPAGAATPTLLTLRAICCKWGGENIQGERELPGTADLRPALDARGRPARSLRPQRLSRQLPGRRVDADDGHPRQPADGILLALDPPSTGRARATAA